MLLVPTVYVLMFSLSNQLGVNVALIQPGRRTNKTLRHQGVAVCHVTPTSV